MKKRIDHLLPILYKKKKNTHTLYYKDEMMKDVINQCIFNIQNWDKKEFDNDAALNNIHEVCKRINPPAHNANSKHHLVDSDNCSLGWIGINSLIGTKDAIILMVVDISSDKMYIYLRNVGNNINNNNDVTYWYVVSKYLSSMVLVLSYSTATST